MALRAGYYGIKKALQEKVKAIPAIKTISTGLNLSKAGALTLKTASASQLGGIKVGEGLSIENGVLSATAQGSGAQYSTTEFDTGDKWIDGSPIYGIVYDFTSAPVSFNSGANGAPSVMDTMFSTSRVLIGCKLIRGFLTDEKMCVVDAAMYQHATNNTNHINTFLQFPSVNYIIAFYVKKED